VIWLRLLYRNQVDEYGLFIVMVSSVELTTLMLETFVGNPPGTEPNQSCGTAFIMLIQNMMSSAVTGVPFDHM
jgi:hypothetical protein